MGKIKEKLKRPSTYLFVALVASMIMAVLDPIGVGLLIATSLVVSALLLLRSDHIDRGRPAKGTVETFAAAIRASQQQELATQFNERDFEQVSALLPRYVALLGLDLRVVKANERFRLDFGDRIGKHCICGKKFREQICADCPANLTLSDGAIHTAEQTLTTRDGEEAKVLLCSAPALDANGDTAGVLTVSVKVADIDQPKELVMMGLAIAWMAHRFTPPRSV